MSTLTKILKPFDRFLPEENRLELIWLLAKMDFSKRYYESILGLFWALINPFFKVIIYYVAFTYLIERGRDGIDNFALYLFSGLIVLSFFTEGTNKSLRLLKKNSYLSENTQFEKMDLFIAAGIGTTLGFVFNVIAFCAFALLLGEPVPPTIVFLPVLIFNLFLLVLGLSLILSTCYIFFKDLQQIWSLSTLLFFWTSPIFFSGEMIANKFPFMPFVQPIFGIIENIRAVLLFGNMPDYFFLAYNYLYAFAFLALGLWVFRKFEHKALEKLL